MDLLGEMDLCFPGARRGLWYNVSWTGISARSAGQRFKA